MTTGVVSEFKIGCNQFVPGCVYRDGGLEAATTSKLPRRTPMTAITRQLDERLTSIAALPGIGLFVTRVATALIFLYHGWPKATDWAMATDKFIGFGLPGFLGPLVGILEVVFGLTLLVGFMTRVSSIVLGVIIIVALLAVQLPGGSVSAGLERDAMILAATIVLAAYGPGRWAADRTEG